MTFREEIIKLWWRTDRFRFYCGHYLERLFGWFPLRIVRKSTLEWYADMDYRFGCVLNHTTGRMSKTNYTLQAMYSEIDDAFTKQYDDGYEQGVKDAKGGA